MVDLSLNFETTDSVFLHYSLGFEVWRTARVIFFSQQVMFGDTLMAHDGSRLFLSLVIPNAETSLYYQMAYHLLSLLVRDLTLLNVQVF